MKQTAEARKLRSRYQRDRSPPGFILQPRDVEMLAFLSEVRFATRDHFAALFFGPRSPFVEGGHTSDGRDSCKTRLQFLWQHRYLNRHFFPPFMLGLGSRGNPAEKAFANSPAIYSLTLQGAEQVALLRNVPMADIPYERKPSELNPSFVGHELATTDLRTTLALAAGPDLLAWHGTRQAYHRYTTDATGQLAPDAYCRLHLDGTSLHVFIEVDRGTQTIRHRIRKKLRDYERYLKSGAFAERYWDELDRATQSKPTFRLVFLTTQSSRRLESLKAEVDLATRKAVWLTTREQLIQSQEPLRDPIWLRAGREGWQSFWLPPERFFERVQRDEVAA